MVTVFTVVDAWESTVGDAWESALLVLPVVTKILCIQGIDKEISEFRPLVTLFFLEGFLACYPCPASSVRLLRPDVGVKQERLLSRCSVCLVN